MELIFEEVLAFENKDKLQFGHEPDDLFVGYYIKDKRLENQSSDPYMGDFSNLEWQTREARRITASPVSNFGIKTFPQFGAYGFYTPLYGDGTSRVVAPINKSRSTSREPTIELQQDETTVTVTINDGSNMNYDCYRIICRQGHFAHEFITYDKELVIDKLDLPPGTYDVSLIGFKPEAGIVSKESTSLMTKLGKPYGVDYPINVLRWSPNGKYLAVGYNGGAPEAAGFRWYLLADDTLSALTVPSTFPKIDIKRIEWNEATTELYVNSDDTDEKYVFTVSTSNTLTKTTSIMDSRIVDQPSVDWSPGELYLAISKPEFQWYKANSNIGFTVT